MDSEPAAGQNSDHSASKASAKSELELLEEDEFVKSDELESEHIAAEIEEMNRFLDKMQQKLKLNIPPCPSPNPCKEDPTTGSKHQHIRQVQSDSYKLGEQLQELETCYSVADSELEELYRRHCQQRQSLDRIRKEFGVTESLKLQQEREFGLCLQRYDYVGQRTYDWSSRNRDVEKLNTAFQICLDRMCTKVAYHDKKPKVLAEMKLAYNVCNKATQQSIRHAKELEQRLEVFANVRPLWLQPQLCTENCEDELQQKTIRKTELKRFTRLIKPLTPVHISPMRTWLFRMKAWVHQ